MIHQLKSYLHSPVSAKPLAVFRIGFGIMMAISLVRFWAKGWIEDLYITPKFHFPFFGWKWAEVLPGNGMYILFAALILSALLIALGKFYKLSIIFFFLGFTYIELIDKTYYLNHYYFVSVISFLLIFLPAHKEFSIGKNWKFRTTNAQVKRYELGSIRLMLGMVYFFAGIAKINPDWVFEAMPLGIWLRGQTHLPIVGPYLDQEWVAYGFSFFGLVYDCTIPFFLINRKTRPFAYLAVLGFHLACVPLFQIGMFPWIMIVSTLVYFSFESRENSKVEGRGSRVEDSKSEITQSISNQEDLRTGDKDTRLKFNKHYSTFDLRPLYLNNLKLYFLAIFFLIQALLPFRYLLYPGELFWTEAGYRFSWRVMLMEKAGIMFYTVKGIQNGIEVGEQIDHQNFLTPNQEKMVATQPDMLLDYARILETEYRAKGWDSIQVFAETYVTVNGRRSAAFTRKEVDLLSVSIQNREDFIHSAPF